MEKRRYSTLVKPSSWSLFGCMTSKNATLAFLSHKNPHKRAYFSALLSLSFWQIISPSGCDQMHALTKACIYCQAVTPSGMKIETWSWYQYADVGWLEIQLTSQFCVEMNGHNLVIAGEGLHLSLLLTQMVHKIKGLELCLKLVPVTPSLFSTYSIGSSTFWTLITL